ncbi:MAG: PQQ-dependent sugar dehydrogenase [Desulfurococcales archaeon]|nr:PQQ-dependent sugar dehydrogenase [Desulfurococcales archaeon]
MKKTIMSRRKFLSLVIGLTGSVLLGFYLGSKLVDVNVKKKGKESFKALGEDYLDQFEHVAVATGLLVPWAIVPLEDGSLIVTERPGRISLVSGGRRVTIARFQVAAVGEAGLLGADVHPDFPGDRRLYVYATFDVGGRLENRVLSIRLSRDLREAVEVRTLLDGIPGARIHDGGRLRVGPDSMIYATTGDAAEPSLAQDLRSLAGKILRLGLEGEVPDDNPFPGSPVYSYGHRNPQGIDWHPGSLRMYSSEHGPVGRDELNEIVAGGNYGWPYTSGLEGEWREGLRKPVIDFGSTSIAPSGASFVRKGLGLEGDMLIACLRGSMLVRVAFNPEGGVEGYEYMLRGRYGRLRDVVPHPEGGVLVATSNRDGRGIPRSGDDKVIWIREG